MIVQIIAMSFTQKIQINPNSIPRYKLKCKPEMYNENLLLPTKLTLEENNQVLKKLNLSQ